MEETKSINELKKAEWNPRTISERDFNALVNSMREFGDLSGVVKNIQTGDLVGGHQRLEAFKKLSADQIVITSRVTDSANGTIALGYIVMPNGERFSYREVDWPLSKEKSANVAANRIQGEFNLDMLAELNYELSQLDNGADLLALTGQTEQEISQLLDSVSATGNEAEAEAPPVDDVNPAVSQLGQIYQLGSHRLMCGDSTDMGQVSDLINGAPIDMVFTDPPYNAAFNGRSGNHEVIMNDDMDAGQFKAFITQFMETLYMVAEGAPKYICTDWKMYPLIYGLMKQPSACLVWVKNMFGMGNGYRHQHELIVFEGSLAANDQSDVWEIKRDNGADYDHPTQKPVALPEKAIRNSSLRDGIVLDLFGGSGPTVIAAEKLGRKAYVMELDPKYCDVIRKRYAAHIGQEDWQAATPVIS